MPHLAERLDAAVTRGLLGIGLAHRVALAAQLALTASGVDPDRAGGISGEALGRTLGLSRAAVHKHVEQLRALGFAVESVAGTGYRLIRPFTDLVAAEAVLPILLELLDTERPWVAGLPYHYVAGCESTNQVLKREAASAPSGAIAVTDKQTGGRGRLGRTWVSQAGKDLTFSVLLHTPVAPAQAHLLSLAGTLAVAEVLETLPGLEERVGIKWPNDVLVGAKKVCGILLEGSMDADRLQWAVAGIGVNVNSDPAVLVDSLVSETEDAWLGRLEPTSLRQVLGSDVSRGPLLAALLARLTDRWNEMEHAGILDGLRQRDVLVGRRVAVLSGPPRDEPVVVGVALGVGPEGQLLVQDDSGKTVMVYAGDVSVRDTHKRMEAGTP